MGLQVQLHLFSSSPGRQKFLSPAVGAGVGNLAREIAIVAQKPPGPQVVGNPDIAVGAHDHFSAIGALQDPGKPPAIVIENDLSALFKRFGHGLGQGRGESFEITPTPHVHHFDLRQGSAHAIGQLQ